MSEMFNPTKRLEISTPYDPVHLTHVGFNSSTGEFTGLPKEWQQLLQESGISRSEQEKNPQAVMEIVKFYQEANGDPWDKLGNVGGNQELFQPKMEESFQNPVSFRYLLLYYRSIVSAFPASASSKHQKAKRSIHWSCQWTFSISTSSYSPYSCNAFSGQVNIPAYACQGHQKCRSWTRQHNTRTRT
jgi:hypothetical protein